MTFIATKLFHKAGEGSGGGGGGDQHNLGWYATETALTTAHPTASDGDYAIVGDTDTVWVWDSDTTAWVDSDQKGQVTSVNGQTGDVVLDLLPSQTGQSGKCLMTDGSTASWSNRPIVKNTQSAGGMAIGSGASISGSNLYSLAVYGTITGYDYCVAIGFGAKCKSNSGGVAGSQIAIGENANTNSSGSIAIGRYANVNISTNKPAIQIGTGTNNTANTMCVGLGGSTNYMLLDTDGSIPSNRLKNAINKYSAMPTASADNLGWIVQFTGTPDSTYTHGHLYECVSDGADPATYSWEEVSIGGGSGLPDQTGKGGRFLATDGTDASWSDNIQITGSSGSYGILSIGVDANVPQSTAFGGIAIGQSTSVTGKHGISIGTSATASTGISIGKGTSSAANGISIGGGSAPNGGIHIGMFGANSTQSTMTVSLGTTALNYQQYTLLVSDGTIPAARHATLPVADGTYTLQLVITNGVPTLSWVAV